MFLGKGAFVSTNGYADRVIHRLRGEKLKITPQRIAILHYLEGNTAHPSAEQIYREVSRAYPAISLATVYNTLDTLQRLGELQVVAIDPSRKRYDPDTRPHHHAMCTECRMIQDVHADYEGAIALPDGVREQLQVASVTVHFSGLCRSCSPVTI